MTDEKTAAKSTKPNGTSRDYAVRKLAKARPDLFAMVTAGKLSAHAAMIEAGFRLSTFTVRDCPESLAKSIRRRWSPERIAELVQLLSRVEEQAS